MMHVSLTRCALFLTLGWGVGAMAQQTTPPAAPATPPAATAPAVPTAPAADLTPPAAAQAHPRAFVYPPGYDKRLRIHKIASYATLPLFATEVALGNSLINNPQQGGAVKAAHGIVGAGIIGLFGVNTVTGVWNLWDARHDPNDRGLRTAHGVLMLVADAGFVATFLNTPHTRGPQAANFTSQARLHRNLAYISIGVGTIGYALMLFHHSDH